MEKVKKLKGMLRISITDDEKLLGTINSRNGIYVTDLNTSKVILHTKTVSNASHLVISPDKHILAAKNTQGTIALISMETGEELGRNAMMGTEGTAMVFTPDSKYLMDFDWDGHYMLLNCENMQFQLLPGPKHNGLTHTSILFDRYSNQIYQFVCEERRRFGKGCIFSVPADPGNFSFSKLRAYEEGMPESLDGFMSFCKKHNYYLDPTYTELICADKQFAEKSRFSIPIYSKNEKMRASNIWVSPGEQYVLIKMVAYDETSRSYETAFLLYKLDTMEFVRTFEYDYIWDFTTIEDDEKFLIATLGAIYFGKL